MKFNLKVLKPREMSNMFHVFSSTSNSTQTQLLEKSCSNQGWRQELPDAGANVSDRIAKPEEAKTTPP